jgi:hypothetical protein
LSDCSINYKQLKYIRLDKRKCQFIWFNYCGYIIGHTNKKLGLNIFTGKYLDSTAFQSLLKQYRLPRLLFLNTCYGIEIGLAQAAIDMGINTVIASSGPIPIKHMSQYAERFFKIWAEEKLPVSKTLYNINKEFEDKRIQFTFLGNGRMTYNSIKRL